MVENVLIKMFVNECSSVHNMHLNRTNVNLEKCVSVIYIILCQMTAHGTLQVPSNDLSPLI